MNRHLLILLTVTAFILLAPGIYAGAAEGDIVQQRLKNGLTILMEENKDSSLVSINAYVRVGSKDERQSEEGISHFCEHLFFRGTQTSSGAEFKSSLEALGGMCNAETSKDYTRYYINIPSVHCMKGLELITDALQHARFDEKEIEQERKVILEEYSMGADNFSRFFYDTLFEMAFPTHPYGKTTIGFEKNLKAFKRDDFISYRKRFYSPENLIFVIVGNFDRDKVSSFLTQAYASIPRSSYGEQVFPAEKRLAQVKEKTVKKDIDDSYLAMGFLGPSVKDRDTIYATDVLCFMLGMGTSSLLTRDLVERRKLVKEISVNFQTQRDEGLIVILSTLKTNDIDTVKKEILAGTEQVAAGNFTDDDVKRAKNLLKNSFIFGNETNDGKASSIGFYEAIDSYEFALDYPRNIDGVTRENLMNTARKLFSSPYCAIIVKPEEKKKRKFDDEE
ncbi:MAG: pitrilysin family protein [Candidatus Eremiobacteraeota bacterium]|nr:pitrilysin family protein [Candidatus Eremiobacteraeota bacterium]